MITGGNMPTAWRHRGGGRRRLRRSLPAAAQESPSQLMSALDEVSPPHPSPKFDDGELVSPSHPSPKSDDDPLSPSQPLSLLLSPESQESPSQP